MEFVTGMWDSVSSYFGVGLDLLKVALGAALYHFGAKAKAAWDKYKASASLIK